MAILGPTPDDNPPAANPSRPLGAGFWTLWASSGMSNLADGIFQVVLPLIAVQFTRSPTAIAGLTFAATLPWLLFALPAGALTDRVDRRRAMMVANSCRSLLLVALVFVSLLGGGSMTMTALYAVALGAGIAETIYDTSAQSIVPQLLGRDQLSRGNARLFAVELTANQFAGPPLAGFLAALGTAIAFTAPAALWALAVVALLLVRGRFRIARDRPTTLRTDIAEGLRFLWRNRILRTLAMMVGLFNFATNATFTIFVLFAVGIQSPMRLSEQAYGILLTSTAVGSVVGSVLAARLERRLGRARSLVLAYLTGALLVGIPALTTNPYLIGAAFFVGGVGIAIGNVIGVSLRQRITPDRLLGRVNSGFRLVAWGTRPLGAAVGGVLAELLELRAVFGIMALIMLALPAGMLIVTNARMDAAERDADHH